MKTEPAGQADTRPADAKPAPPQGATSTPLAAQGTVKQETPGGAAAAGAGAGDPSRKPVESGGETVGAMPYTLQVGAFSTSENARKQKGWFEDHGYAAEIVSRVRGGKSLYLVWVGSFATANDARGVLREIQSKYNITPIVVER